jgi:hypothetical protein
MCDLKELEPSCVADDDLDDLEEWLLLTEFLAPEFVAAPFFNQNRRWGSPYIEQENESFRVSCVDGGAWDRPTLWGKFGSLQEAVECIKHGPIWRQANDLQKK